MNDHYPPIGILSTCFTEKFGIPRQSLMITEARGVLKLNPDPAYRAALNHLEKFSHVWLIFVFHQNGDRAWRPTIDPPRVGAPKAMGVFASRSPHRPNPIGLSAVKLDRIDFEASGGIEIHISGVDLLDGTPVLDIKPYLPFADQIPDANGGWAQEEIVRYPVEFSTNSLNTLESALESHPKLQLLIQQMLEWDPRPTSQREANPMANIESEGKRFAFRVLEFDVHWEVRKGGAFVAEIVALKPISPKTV